MENKRTEVSDYYDKFSVKQSEVGINIRHRGIIKRLKKIGLNKSSTVLEIGCGIGVLTGLMSPISATVHAVDISPQSIETAKERLANYSNVSFEVNDMVNFRTDVKFDFIVLPDVLEHIPIEQHKSLFEILSSALKDSGTICINIPDPFSLDFVRLHQPKSLQIIDQSIHVNQLSEAVYPAGLFIHTLHRYSLHYSNPDYVWIELRKLIPYQEHPQKGKFLKIKDEIFSRI